GSRVPSGVVIGDPRSRPPETSRHWVAARPTCAQLSATSDPASGSCPGKDSIRRARLAGRAAVRRYAGVSDQVVAELIVELRSVSYEKKPNILFRTIGPPTLPPP